MYYINIQYYENLGSISFYWLYKRFMKNCMFNTFDYRCNAAQEKSMFKDICECPQTLLTQLNRYCTYMAILGWKDCLIQYNTILYIYIIDNNYCPFRFAFIRGRTTKMHSTCSFPETLSLSGEQYLGSTVDNGSDTNVSLLTNNCVHDVYMLKRWIENNKFILFSKSSWYQLCSVVVQRNECWIRALCSICKGSNHEYMVPSWWWKGRF